jgi:hypothetical protein
VAGWSSLSLPSEGRRMPCIAWRVGALRLCYRDTSRAYVCMLPSRASAHALAHPMRAHQRFSHPWRPCRTMLQECPSRATAATKGSVVATLHNLHRSGRCQVQGAVLCCSSGPDFRCHLRLDLYVKSDAITGALPWEPNRSLGCMFSSMIPATQTTVQDATACPLCASLSEQSAGQQEACCLCSQEHQPEQEHNTECQRATEGVPGQHVQGSEHQWNLSASDLRARVLDSLLAPAKSESNAAPFKLHSCFEELPNWLVVASEYPPIPPPRPGVYY